MNCIDEYHEELNKIEAYEHLTHVKIVEAIFCYENDDNHGEIPMLYLSILLRSTDGKINKVVKSKYFNVHGLQLTGALYISGELILLNTHDRKTGKKDYRYYIHDDNGYGDDDGFNSIEFYCDLFKLIEVTDYLYE